MTPQQRRQITRIVGHADHAKDLTHYPGYAITLTGRLFSLKTDPPRELRGILHRGYRRFCMYVHGAKYNVFAHRLVAQTFLPPPRFPNPVIRHLDGNPLNNHLTNLKWGTAQQNVNDTRQHGRTAIGARIGTSKLTAEHVRAIRTAIAEGEALRKIGQRFGISRTAVWDIKHGRTWRHIV